MGRPSTYNSRIAKTVLEAVEAGSTIQAACDAVGVKRTTFLNWRALDTELKSRLGRAKSGQQPMAQKFKKRIVARPAQRTKKSGKAGTQPARVVRAEKPAILPAPVAREAPIITGSCAWAVNRAAAVMLVELGGAVFDELRRELRRTGEIS